MNEFYKLASRLIKPYKTYAFLNVLFNFLGIVFSLFSLTLIVPFLGVLFNSQTLIMVRPALSLSITAVKENLYYFFSLLIVEHGKTYAIFSISFLVVVTMFLKSFFLFLANYFMAPIRSGILRDMRNQIFSKILHLPISYFTDERKGDIMSRISTDVQEIEWSIVSSLEMAFRDPINIIIFLVGLIVISPSLTIFVLILLPISGLIIGKLGRSLRSSSLKGQNKMGELFSIVEETLSGLRIIKAFNADKLVEDKFRKENEEFFHISNKVARRRYLASPLSEFLGTVVVAIILIYGGAMVLRANNPLSAQSFISYIAIFSQIINPAKSLSSAFYNIRKGMSSIDRVNKILLAENNIIEIPDAKEIKEFKSGIEFKNVSFRYELEPVLKNINLKVEKGRTIAIVGQSGSGKSTLVDLIPRFYDISEGEITIDGLPIKECKIKDIRKLIGYVNQEPILFNDTFYNNIAFGTENVTLEQVEAAAKVANAHEFIVSGEEGYNTNIGDRGNKLSGGQRQRISIARAILKNPPILILDEATSSLDTESERLVQDALTNLMKNRTSIVIAHRLSTIKHADEIIVLHEGEIVERGTHDELIEKDGVYNKLHKMQMF
jgi:ATP-binding cassette, subfamily B, bacterial MsbA